jgi:hypothetical protein
MGRLRDPSHVDSATLQRGDGIGEGCSAMLHHVIVCNVQYVEARVNQTIRHVRMAAHLHGRRPGANQTLVRDNRFEVPEDDSGTLEQRRSVFEGIQWVDIPYALKCRMDTCANPLSRIAQTDVAYSDEVERPALQLFR